MGDRPARFWDVDECRWVRFTAADADAAAAADDVVMPPQPTAGDDRPVAAAQEADVRSG